MLKGVALFISMSAMIISAIKGKLSLTIANGFLVLVNALNLIFLKYK